MELGYQSKNREKKGQMNLLIGSILRKIREASNLSQAAVAHSAELSLRHYQSIEYGRISCRMDTLSRILGAMKQNFFLFYESFLIEQFYQLGFPGVERYLLPGSFELLSINENGQLSRAQLGHLKELANDHLASFVKIILTDSTHVKIHSGEVKRPDRVVRAFLKQPDQNAGNQKTDPCKLIFIRQTNSLHNLGSRTDILLVW